MPWTQSGCDGFGSGKDWKWEVGMRKWEKKEGRKSGRRNAYVRIGNWVLGIGDLK